ncbi:hypothetical protein FHL15_005609 [Xylaria flabelliformis]|uniref:SnoaL-like domain-containing protein n=1 Tax=Xylaria flabelliformis TaxID=2512241 RepID=A0A553I0A8_9PEZI|nr:hypothetical protein FHL15_005609 [Xylaria flabelliformis]
MASLTEGLRSTIESIATQFLTGPSRAVEAKDPSLCLAVVTAECPHHLRPLAFATANPLLKAVKSNEEHKALMESALSTMEETRAEIKELVIDTVKRKASVLAEHCTKIIGVEANILEVTWFLDFTENGKQVSRVTVFIDTATATRRVADMKKRGFMNAELQ